MKLIIQKIQKLRVTCSNILKHKEHLYNTIIITLHTNHVTAQSHDILKNLPISTLPSLDRDDAR